MATRRKFITQGTMATAAILALKPFETMARISSPFTGLGNSASKLVFLHTAGNNRSLDYRVIRHIKKTRNNHINSILLKAGQTKQDEAGQLTYDASVHGINDQSASAYKIIVKGKFRTGIINAKPEEKDIIEKINALSSFLKKDKNCNIVVCLSLLGYKNNNTPDDVTLAEKSTHLDMIIGGHTKNFHKHPVITLNSKKEEVIIHAVSENSIACGVINIDFDGNGQKKFIGFSA
jgi:hypothetical protein